MTDGEPVIFPAVTFDEDLDNVPDPNGHPNMVGEVLADTFDSTHPEVTDGNL